MKNNKKITEPLNYFIKIDFTHVTRITRNQFILFVFNSFPDNDISYGKLNLIKCTV